MIPVSEYQARRQALVEKLPANSLALIPAAYEQLRNGDSHYRFRQDSDFYYLTGFNEPEAVLVILSGPSQASILFNLPPDPIQEQWQGRRLGQVDAPAVLGVDEAYSIEDFTPRFHALLADREAVYYPRGRFPEWEKTLLDSWREVKKQVRRGVKAPEVFSDLSGYLSELRLFKSKAEIALIRQAVAISVEAHKRAMRASPQASFEYQLESELLSEFIRQGCRSTAYDSIVASGENACILHYTANDKRLADGELVLIDAGGEYQNYAADITRTYPRNGRFSAEQKAIYELVQKAQQAGLRHVRPGVMWDAVQASIVATITEGLVELGLLKGRVEELIAKEAYKPFYMHQSGHWLGLDVHDCGAYKVNGTWRTFEPGMVLTVEPGIYISSAIPEVDERWHGIGVRIEDDILVTDQGHENLSEALPVAVSEIEALICGG